jgi:hypothetical protein
MGALAHAQRAGGGEPKARRYQISPGEAPARNVVIASWAVVRKRSRNSFKAS